MEYILDFLIGAAAGAGVVWFILSQNAKAGGESVSEIANLRAKLDAANQRIADQSDLEKTMLNSFKVMANDVLKENNDAFMKTADEKIGALVTQANKDFTISKEAVGDMIKPLSDELKRVEEARNKSQGSITEQIKALQENNNSLAAEARNLSSAIRRPEVRGSWGEIHLRRVVELAGMQPYCDFEEQVSVTAEDGSRDRPDMVVRMPNNRTIVVDAKTPMDAYLAAVESDTDEQREEQITRHARQVRDRAQNLSKKSYHQIFERSPDFVVMFLPGEYLLTAALEIDRQLSDWALERNVIIATPNTLVALLKAVHAGWREAQLNQEAANIAKLGSEIYERITTFAEHMARMRNSLEGAVTAFNRGAGSLERRVLPAARRFPEYGIPAGKEIPELRDITTHAQEFRSAELREASDTVASEDD